MKKGKILFLSLFLTAAAGLFAESVNYEPYFYDMAVRQVEKAGAPIISDDYIVFTAEAKYRHVGIAFDFEDFKIVHPFEKLNYYDEDMNITRNVLFYCYERTHEINSLQYRLVFDGLWACDPFNPDKVYDEKCNLYFSRVTDANSVQTLTKSEPSKGTRFIYKGESGLKLFLSGTFCSWDPWMYQMKETEYGLYELTLPLPKGTYYYNYYSGLTPLIDNTNEKKVYTPDGRTCSVIEVK